MDNLLIVGTTDGLLICKREHDTWRIMDRGLANATVTGVTCQGNNILAATTNGIFRSADQGRSWLEASTGLTERLVRQIAFHPSEPGIALAGTEPAAIFVTGDAGQTWRECPEVTQLRSAKGWFLPYSPGAGCIRAFSFHSQQIYAAAEVGGLLRSNDTGASWQLVPGSTGNPDFHASVPRTYLHPDVHDVAINPQSPELVWAATMQGLYRSTDAGNKWLHIYADCYVRALWVDAHNPLHIVLGPADDVSINGQIEQSYDGGYSWISAADGLTVPWRRAIVERFVQVDDQLFAIVSDGRLFVAPIPTLHWRPLFTDQPMILAVAALSA